MPWVDLAAVASSSGTSAVERRIGVLLAKLPAPAEFTASSEARVAARLRASVRGQAGRERARHRRRLVLGWALGAGVLLVSGAVIAGGGVGPVWERLKPRVDALFGGGRRVAVDERPSPTSGPRADLAMPDVAVSQPAPAVPAQTTDSVARPLDGEATTAVRQRQPSYRQRQLDREPIARSRQRRATGARYAGAEGRAVVAAPDHSSSEATGLAVVAAPREKPAPVGPEIAEASTSASASSWARAAEPPPSPARRAAAEPSSEAPPSQLSQEARLLNLAMVQLRQRRDGAAALATLNEYLQHYPQGTLAAEARGARIDALLLLQRKGEALKALDATRLEPVGRGQELLVIRGELRARRDCASAIRDFELVLGRAAPAPLEERALFGRAVCRRRQGDEQGARVDADAYLARFPDGRFASTVRGLTGGGSGRAR